MSQSLIIVGAGLAGWTTAREFRKLDTTTPVQLVTADSGDFYAKPALSNAFAQSRLPAQLVSTPAAKMAATNNPRPNNFNPPDLIRRLAVNRSIIFLKLSVMQNIYRG